MHFQIRDGRWRGYTVLMLALTAILVVIVSGCGSGSGSGETATGAAVKSGGVFRIGTHYIPNSINPFTAYAATAYSTFQYVYPQLVVYNTSDKSLPIEGSFAQTWEMAPDGLTWTFNVVPNAKWSDGSPLTAKDAAFTINTIVKYRTGAAASLFALCENVRSAEATDDTTLVIHMSKPSAILLPNLVRLSILPEKVWAKYATGNGSQLKTFANPAPMVSGGPFELTQYVQNDHLLCTANPNWWGAKKPYIDGFGVKFFSSQDAEVLALKNGEIDFIWPLPTTSATMLKQAGFTVSDTPASLIHDIIINSNKKMKAHRELLIPDVRLAMAHAVDLQKIVDVAYQGHAQPAGAWIPPSTGAWSDTQLKPETFDLGLAAKLLNEAGCTLGSDGIRRYQGAKMEYDVIFPTDEIGAGDRVFQIYQADFRQLGIVLHQKSVDNSTAFSLITADNYGDFQMGQWSWSAQVDPNFLLSLFTTQQLNALSDCGYSNPAYDKLFAEQAGELDKAKRLKMVWQMQEILYKDKPYIPTAYVNYVEATSPTWTGMIPSLRGSWNNLSMESLLQVHQVQ